MTENTVQMQTIDADPAEASAWFYGPDGEKALAIPAYWLEAHTEGRPIEVDFWRKQIGRTGGVFFLLRPQEEFGDKGEPLAVDPVRIDLVGALVAADGSIALQIPDPDDVEKLRAWLSARPDIV